MLLDFDTTVTGIASQPFWLFWTTSSGKIRSHALDFFTRRSDGSAAGRRPLGRAGVHVFVGAGAAAAFVMSLFNSAAINGFFGFGPPAQMWGWTAWKGWRPPM